MGKLFGTDGIRGIANLDLTPQLAFEVGRAAAYILSKNKNGRVIVGKDTRKSGDLIETSLACGLMSIGLDVELAGVIPTPGIAYLTKTGDYLCGVEISASHNPFEYNGIKFFSSEGYKLPDEVEEQIEEVIYSDTQLYRDATGNQVGTLKREDRLVEKYKDYLLSLTDQRFDGLTVCLDTGNGALSKIAKEVLEHLGATVYIINDKPNGENINDQCGSTNPTLIADFVLEKQADMGMSFDGDADRIIAVDEKGRIVDGDHILAICATYLKENNQLKNNACVGTIMSNIGLEKYLASIDVELIQTKVGDRYILEEMKNSDYVLGAEQSGHVIFLDFNTTGDGLATGIHLLEIMVKKGQKLSQLNDLMISYPQVLVNAKVRNDLKNRYLEFPEIVQGIEKLERKYKDEGRIVIRSSGTEPLVRVMLEGSDTKVLKEDAIELAKIIEKTLN
ncbi:MAG: phosphoglucosamine mutase [Tissierellia bacterium]|nr:phosphoglucosamine mutase [Tissierellia bacterium]